MAGAADWRAVCGSDNAVIALTVADRAATDWAQRQVAAHHYLHAPVDPRSRPLVYIVELHHPQILPQRVGCLIFGRPESSRCYQGALTYGSQADVAAGRAQFDRWCILNLARVWLDPSTQPYGRLWGTDLLPHYIDRHGCYRSTLASTVISQALARVGYDYLAQHPPVDCQYPYQILAVLSYCDRRRHKGTIYRAASWELARTNEQQIETWYTPAVAPLTREQDVDIRRRSEVSHRSQRIRAKRAQLELPL